MKRNEATKKGGHAPVLAAVALGAYLLSLFDLWYTLYAVDFVAAASEANPVFRVMLEHPLVAVTYKFAFIPMFLYVMYRCRETRIARVGLWFSFLFYLANAVYQIRMMGVYW